MKWSWTFLILFAGSWLPIETWADGKALRAKIQERASRLESAAARCEERIRRDEIDECEVRIDWENRSVSIAEARSAAGELRRGLHTFQLAVKSFIHRLDLSSLSPDVRGRAERVFARMTNAGFSENPPTPSRDVADYRLWSAVDATVSCRGNQVAAWAIDDVRTSFGKEFGILGAEGGVMRPLRGSRGLEGERRLESVDFSYAIRGRPNQATLPSFRAVHQRSCVWIWHQVEATVECRSGRPELAQRLTGSRFPSHRTWIDNRQRPTLDQGPFATLWECDSNNPEMVR